jgi:benzoyl-CoA reductase/2-hydroxyglutaryl-CoA dehydratase subunit BcrC/BadD/HgdB
LQRVGFTTTIPLEVLIAAGRKPVDLNNVFITGGKSRQLVEVAELYGFPRNVCGWIKGIYAAIRESGIDEVVAVTEGDCSYTKALMEVLTLEGMKVFAFAYPHDRNAESLRPEIEKLMRHFAVGWDGVNRAKARLDGIRLKIREIDRLTWQDDLVSGAENHYFQVSSSDMNGDPDIFEAEADSFLGEALGRAPRKERIRLAYIGVPPIFTDLYPFLESHGARVVFNETQRQFAMPFDTADLIEQYLAYTYPYDIFHRLADIAAEVERRRVDAVIHYVQSFCFRQIEDLIVRKRLSLPILTLEGDKPTPLDARTKIRIESFLEMLDGRDRGPGTGDRRPET